MEEDQQGCSRIGYSLRWPRPRSLLLPHMDQPFMMIIIIIIMDYGTQSARSVKGKQEPARRDVGVFSQPAIGLAGYAVISQQTPHSALMITGIRELACEKWLPLPTQIPLQQ